MGERSKARWLYLAIAFAVVAIAAELWSLNGANTQAAESTQGPQKMELLHKKVLEQAPETSPAIADDRLSAKTHNPQEKGTAVFYWEYWFMNTKARAAYCQEQGGTLNQWMTTFERKHENETVKARIISARENINEDEVYAKASSSLFATVEDEMTELATIQRVTPKQLCEMFEDKSDQMVRRMLFSKNFPQFHKILMDAQY